MSDWGLLATLWIIMGLIAGVIASDRDASFGYHFVLGMLLGPLGILIAAVAPKRPPRPGGPAAGWYDDPTRRHQHRYWDGYTWTAHVADAGVQSHDTP